MSDLDLYLRGIRTAVACWTAYARTIPGGAVRRLPGVDVAVFTEGPERDVFNNAVLGHGLGPGQRRDAVGAMVSTYAASGITEYAAWVHESDEAMLAELTAGGFTHQETTWAMARTLDGVPHRPDPHVGPGEWSEYLRVLELPSGLLESADPHDFEVVVAELGDEPVGTGMAFDHETDSGIFNVATLDDARRRGLGSAVVAALLAGAAERGRRTATLQSTEMARGVYAGQGFRDFGRILELGPPAGQGR
ncbi:MAG TPA: GNAT family N-acetyltransferase [Nocardioides sp.]|nr:GNAT family N-acetyltransferase [Nocardioides sp.]